MKTPPNLIPLAHANLCHNCQTISQDSANCPACGSAQVERLEPMIGRVPTGRKAAKMISMLCTCGDEEDQRILGGPSPSCPIHGRKKVVRQ